VWPLLPADGAVQATVAAAWLQLPLLHQAFSLPMRGHDRTGQRNFKLVRYAIGRIGDPDCSRVCI